MTVMDMEPVSITRGDLRPDLEVVIGDDANDVNFSGLTVDDVTVFCEMDGLIVASGHPDTITPQAANKELLVVREWVDGETDTAGRMYITVEVKWSDGDPQTFPDDTPLMLHIRRKAGDP